MIVIIELDSPVPSHLRIYNELGTTFASMVITWDMRSSSSHSGEKKLVMANFPSVLFEDLNKNATNR